MFEPNKPKIEFVKDHLGLLQLILTLLILTGVGVGAFLLLPFVVEILRNLVLTVVFGALASVLGYVLFNGQFQKAVVLFLDNWILKLKNAVIAQDPFGTAQNMIKRLIKRKEMMAGYVGGLKGALGNITKTINKFSAQRETALNYAKTADREHNDTQVRRWSNTAQRYAESIQRLTPLQETAKALYVFLLKMLELVDSEISEQEEALKIALEEYNITEQSKNAVQAAQAAMSGDDVDTFNQAMDVIARRTAVSLGEVELFMDMTQPLLDAKDFENKAKTQQAVDNFRKWLQSDSTLLPAQEKKELLISSGAAPAIFLGAEAEQAAQPDTESPRRPLEDKYNLVNRQ